MQALFPVEKLFIYREKMEEDGGPAVIMEMLGFSVEKYGKL